MIENNELFVVAYDKENVNEVDTCSIFQSLEEAQAVEVKMKEKGYEDAQVFTLSEAISIIVGDLRQRVADEYADEYQIGYDEGFEHGYEGGRDEAFEEGHEQGFEEGHEQGFDEGYAKGHQDGYSDGYHNGSLETRIKYE